MKKNLFIIILTIFLLISCATKDGNVNLININNELEEKLSTGIELYNKGKYTRAKDDFDYIILNDRGSDIGLEARYYQAESLFKLEQYEESISSFEIISAILPPLSLEYKINKMFKEGDDYATSNGVLEIKNGEYIRGQMDKDVFGSGGKGMIQRIANDFSNRNSQEFIDNIQSIVTEYMKTSGFSVGISDLITDDDTNKAIRSAILDHKKEIKNLEDQFHLNIFENKTGRSNEDEFEIQVSNILSSAMRKAEKVAIKCLDENNRFMTIVQCGSKGKTLNIAQMISKFIDQTLVKFSI